MVGCYRTKLGNWPQIIREGQNALNDILKGGHIPIATTEKDQLASFIHYRDTHLFRKSYVVIKFKYFNCNQTEIAVNLDS